VGIGALEGVSPKRKVRERKRGKEGGREGRGVHSLVGIRSALNPEVVLLVGDTGRWSLEEQSLHLLVRGIAHTGKGGVEKKEGEREGESGREADSRSLTSLPPFLPPFLPPYR